MKRVFLLTSLCLVCVLAACGSDDEGTSPGAGGGSGGKQGTTCADGYPAVGTACALNFETCKSCPPAFACCDVFECQNGAWAKTQSTLSCPVEAGAETGTEAGADAENEAADAGGD